MGIYYKHLIFIISLLLFVTIVTTSYFVGKKWGIKKALYRITYTSVCVIFAFLLSPYVNEYILNYDLYSAGKAIKYNGLHFYRIIDFIEEVIVHNKILNDIYNLVPSLKRLLMDFPHLLFVPVTYVLLFIFFKIIFFPLYLYLSYKRRRRILYNKKVSKTTRIWAGTITAVHSVFLISIVLTPVSGLSRIYKYAEQDILEDETICQQIGYLEKYNKACILIEAYNTSVLGFMSDSPLNKYIYGSLTRIDYYQEETSLNDEIVNVARAGLILNKTGLLNAITVDDFNDISKLNFNEMTTQDIDIIVKAFEQSLYTREVIYDVYEWARIYLEWISTDVLNLTYTTEFAYEEIIEELKVVLTIINYVINNKEYLDNINEVYTIIKNYMEMPKVEIEKDVNKLKLVFKIAHTLDVNGTRKLISMIKDSKLFEEYATVAIDKMAKTQGLVVYSHGNSDELYKTIMYGLDLVEIMQNHRNIKNVVKLLSSLTKNELYKIAQVAEYLINSESMNEFLPSLVKFILSEERIELDVPVDVLYKIKDWKRELELVQLVIQMVNNYIDTQKIDYNKAWYILKNYDNTVLFNRAMKYAISILPKAFTGWIAGKDYKYLVGEYV